MPLLIQTSWNHRVAFFTTSSWRAALSGREPSGKPFSSGGRGQGHPHPRSHPLKAFAWSKSRVYQCHAILCLQVFWGTAIGATLWKPHWHQGNPRYLLPFSHQLSKQIPHFFLCSLALWRFYGQLMLCQMFATLSTASYGKGAWHMRMHEDICVPPTAYLAPNVRPLSAPK